MEVKTIAEQFLFTTCRIETQLANGKVGTATGFIYRVDRDGLSYHFLVTNRHVVRDVKQGSLFFTARKDDQPVLGGVCQVNILQFERGWSFHKDESVDVAVIPFSNIEKELEKNGLKVYFKSIGADLIPTAQQIAEIDALEEIVFIGYPSGIWDQINNLPVMRRGTTATPIQIDFMRKPKFLIDASVFPGSSGSPVFLYNHGWYTVKGKGTVLGTRVLFLGIIASVFFREDDSGRIELATIPTTKVPIPVTKEMVDLGVVFKASVVVEIVQEIMSKVGPSLSKPEEKASGTV